MHVEILAVKLQNKRAELDHKLNLIDQELLDDQDDSLLAQQRNETIEDIAHIDETLELLNKDNTIHDSSSDNQLTH